MKMNKTIYTLKALACILLVASLGSCIKEYNADFDETDEDVLIVEGSIISDTECKFLLTKSISMTEVVPQLVDNLVSGATVSVVGDNGQTFKGRMNAPGDYRVDVGHLDTAHKYYLSISLPNNGGSESYTYESMPMTPLTTPSPTEFEYFLSQNKTKVDIYMSTDNPNSSEVTYFRWDYEEYWELNAPIHPTHEYNRKTEEYQVITQDRSRGWSYQLTHPVIIASNANYAKKGLTKYVLYTIDKDDNRFNTLYFTDVTQCCISKAEYQYIDALNKQSDEMGGLFTPMPSELPSNIVCTKGNARVIGFIGVRANVIHSQQYISGADVGYTIPIKKQAKIFTGPPTGDANSSWDTGYRVAFWDPQVDPSWTYGWCVDTSSPEWGAKTFDKPAFWPR